MTARTHTEILLRALGATQVQVDRAIVLAEQHARMRSQWVREYEAERKHRRKIADRLAKSRAACRRLREERDAALSERDAATAQVATLRAKLAESYEIDNATLRRAVELALECGADPDALCGDITVRYVDENMDSRQYSIGAKVRAKCTDAILAHVGATAPASPSPWIPGPPKKWGAEYILTVRRPNVMGVVWYWNGTNGPFAPWEVLAHMPLPPAYEPPATEAGK